MGFFRVYANESDFGIIEAASEQDARDIAARVAGYKSEADMAERLEYPSELVANLCTEDHPDGVYKKIKIKMNERCTACLNPAQYAEIERLTREYVSAKHPDAELIIEDGENEEYIGNPTFPVGFPLVEVSGFEWPLANSVTLDILKAIMDFDVESLQ